MSWSLLVLLALLGLAYGQRECGPQQPKVIQINRFGSGTLQSPGYPGTYPKMSQCSYLLVAPPGSKIRVSFDKVDLDMADMCTGDSLSVHDSLVQGQFVGPLLAKVCGNARPRDLESTLNTMFIAFNSDFVGEGEGFSLTYTVKPLHESYCPIGHQMCRNRKCYRLSEMCNEIDDCGDGSDEQGCGNRPTQAITGCGVTAIKPKLNASDSDRIVEGDVVVPHSWPWQVSLQLNSFYPVGHMCGGTLISDRWVATASHCFMMAPDKRMWRVHFGKHDKFTEETGEVIRYIDKLIVFPGIPEDQFKETGNFDIGHDITLLKLNAPIVFTDHIRPACLPKPNDRVPVGTTCYTTGWGTTRGTGNNNALKQAITPIIDPKHCAQELMPFVDDNQLCTGHIHGGESPCHGDSGGPLVCQYPNKGNWTLRGIVSYGTDTTYESGLCGLRNAPGVFTRVSAKTTWISKMLDQFGR